MVKEHSDKEGGNQMGDCFWLAASSHRQDSIYTSLCYTIHGALAGTRNSSMGPPMKDRFDNPSQHEWMLLPQSYISLR